MKEDIFVPSNKNDILTRLNIILIKRVNQKNIKERFLINLNK